MPSRNQTLASALVALMLSTPAFAQNTPPAERVIRMSGTVTGATGQQATVRFAIYDAESGGTLLWQETQAVALDQAGQYTAFLGAMSADGVPCIGPCGPRGLFVNAGHGHLGWTLADGSGRLLADLVVGVRPALEPRDYAPQRFA